MTLALNQALGGEGETIVNSLDDSTFKPFSVLKNLWISLLHKRTTIYCRFKVNGDRLSSELEHDDYVRYIKLGQ